MATIHTEETAFNQSTYVPTVIKEGEGEKLPSKDPSKKEYENPGNVIRWQYSSEAKAEPADPAIPSLELGIQNSADGGKAIESNARIIEWSDGTYQLAVGKQLFDIRMEDEHHMKVFAKLEDYLISKSEVNKKIILVPAAGTSGYAPEDYLGVVKHKEEKKEVSRHLLEEGAEMAKAQQEDSESDFHSDEGEHK